MYIAYIYANLYEKSIYFFDDLLVLVFIFLIKYCKIQAFGIERRKKG